MGSASRPKVVQMRRQVMPLTHQEVERHRLLIQGSFWGEHGTHKSSPKGLERLESQREGVTPRLGEVAAEE